MRGPKGPETKKDCEVAYSTPSIVSFQAYLQCCIVPGNIFLMCIMCVGYCHGWASRIREDHMGDETC